MPGRRTFLDHLRWQRVPRAALGVHDPAREAWLAVGYALFYFGAACVTGLLIRAMPMPIWGASRFNQDVWYTFGLKIGLLLVVPVLIYRAAGYRARDLLLGWERQRWIALKLASAYAVGWCVNLGNLPHILHAVAGQPLAVAGGRIALGVVFPLFTAGLPEEIVFRGILQTRLELTLGRLPALLLTAVLFTAWHLPTRFLLSTGVEGRAGDLGSVLLGTGVPVFISGLILGLIWDRFRNLPVLVALHWGVDTLPAVRSMLGAGF